MTTIHDFIKRSCVLAIALALICSLSLGAYATERNTVSVTFWKDKVDKESSVNSAVDFDREAYLTRSANGTYTLELPIKQITKMGVNGYLIGLTIGDVAYDGTVSGSVADGTGVLTIKNLPSSVLTGSAASDSLLVTCNMQMELDLLGCISSLARVSVWAK